MSEKYAKLRREVARLEAEQVKLKQTYDDLWNRYNRKLSAYQDLESLGEGNSEAAKALHKEAVNLKKQSRETKERLRDPKDIAATIARTPGSKLHRLALEAFEGVAKIVDTDQKRIERFNIELAKIKEQYLKVVSRIGESYRQLYEDAWQGKKIQDYLPPEKQTINRPVKAPYAHNFEITDTEIAKAYGRRPAWIE